jgi:preprotein translocase subunit SecE
MSESKAVDHKVRKSAKPNFFVRIGQFISQVFLELRKTVAPTRRGLWNWSFAVFLFVVIIMLLVTVLDFGLGRLTMLIFG